MKVNIYAIYDTAAAVYMKIWTSLTDAQAMREFTDIFDIKDHTIAHHPEDYYLCRLGTFNDNNGTLDPEPVETLLTGLEAVAASNNQATLNFDKQADNIEMLKGTA